MERAVMISIKKEWCDKIRGETKTLEIRKNAPKIEPPFKCYIYESGKGSRTVIGEFICNKITSFGYSPYNHGEYCVSMGEFPDSELLEKSCLSFEEMFDYICDGVGYAWHISNLKIYEDPKELSDFAYPCDGDCPFPTAYINPSPPCENCRKTRLVLRAPQSWRYVEELL